MTEAPLQYEVWQEPVGESGMFKERKISGPYDDREDASMEAYLEDCDDPAPDKHDYRRIVVREVPRQIAISE